MKPLIFASSMILLTGLAQVAVATPAPTPTQHEDAPTVIGTPAPGSKFAKIRVGMYSKEIMDLIGPPTDQKSYATGKAWIPFHFGGDNYRTEYHYKGEGILTFSGGGIGNEGALKLIKIIVNKDESGYIH